MKSRFFAACAVLRAGALARRCTVARCARVVLLAALLGSAAHVDAQQAEQIDASEESIKAAYLYRLADYVEWPEARSAGEWFMIGVLGSPAIAGELEEMTAGRLADGRTVRIERVDADDEEELAELAELDVLFVGARERDRLAEILAAVRGQPVLTVTESEGALGEGSMINFTLSERRVRFEVALEPAAASNLMLNSRLLAVAERVIRRSE